MHSSVETSLEKQKFNALDISESDEDALLRTVTSTIESPWKAMISLNSKRVVFKVDTGADVTVILKDGLRMESN